MRQIPHLFKSVLLVCGLAFFAGEAYSSDPCCNITSVNAKSGLVTARALDGSKTFQFTVKDKSALSSVKDKIALSQLRVGQLIYADFGTRQVSINEGKPCCRMTQLVKAKAPKPQNKGGYDIKKDQKV